MGGVVDAVTKVVENVTNIVSKAVEAAIADPIGTIAKVVAVGTGNAYLLPYISAGSVIAHGGNFEDAVKAGGLTWVAQGVTNYVADQLGPDTTLALKEVADKNGGIVPSSITADVMNAANATTDPIAALNAAAGWTNADINYLQSIGYTGTVVDPSSGIRATVKEIANKGYTTVEQYAEGSAGGFENANEYNTATKEGFTNKTDFTNATKGNFTSAEAYKQAQEGGFKNEWELERAQKGGFTNRDDYMKASEKGITNAKEYANYVANAPANPVISSYNMYDPASSTANMGTNTSYADGSQVWKSADGTTTYRLAPGGNDWELTSGKPFVPEGSVRVVDETGMRVFKDPAGNTYDNTGKLIKSAGPVEPTPVPRPLPEPQPVPPEPTPTPTPTPVPGPTPLPPGAQPIEYGGNTYYYDSATGNVYNANGTINQIATDGLKEFQANPGPEPTPAPVPEPTPIQPGPPQGSIPVDGPNGEKLFFDGKEYYTENGDLYKPPTVPQPGPRGPEYTGPVDPDRIQYPGHGIYNQEFPPPEGSLGEGERLAGPGDTDYEYKDLPNGERVMIVKTPVEIPVPLPTPLPEPQPVPPEPQPLPTPLPEPQPVPPEPHPLPTPLPEPQPVPPEPVPLPTPTPVPTPTPTPVPTPPPPYVPPYEYIPVLPIPTPEPIGPKGPNYGPLPPINWGATTPPTTVGLNPGYLMGRTPAEFAGGTPTQATHYWGQHPYVSDLAHITDYNNIPNAQPWGAEYAAGVGPNRLDVNALIRQIMGPQAQAAAVGTAYPGVVSGPIAPTTKG